MSPPIGNLSKKAGKEIMRIERTKKMKITTKKVTVADVEALQKLSIETFSDTFGAQNDPKDLNEYLNKAYATDKLLAELQNENSEFTFVYLDDQLAGYMKLNTNEAQSEHFASNALEIERIYIKKEFKRHGLGKYLFTKAFDIAKKANKQKVWLGVWEKNTPALAFYTKMGFKQNGSHSFFMGENEQTDLIMEKELIID